VKIGERAILSGGTNVSQFVSIGKAAFIGGGSAIDKDIPCYLTAVGIPSIATRSKYCRFEKIRIG
jgi:UDP-N-acetylglucosamine acyltransferase